MPEKINLFSNVIRSCSFDDKDSYYRVIEDSIFYNFAQHNSFGIAPIVSETSILYVINMTFCH